jgi:hypothetical protein
MMLLKNAHDIDSLLTAVSKCRGDVILRNINQYEEFNLKSTLSRYIAIGELCKDHGDEYEVFCMDKADEGYMIQFFMELDK